MPFLLPLPVRRRFLRSGFARTNPSAGRALPCDPPPPDRTGEGPRPPGLRIDHRTGQPRRVPARHPGLRDARLDPRHRVCGPGRRPGELDAPGPAAPPPAEDSGRRGSLSPVIAVKVGDLEERSGKPLLRGLRLPGRIAPPEVPRTSTRSLMGRVADELTGRRRCAFGAGDRGRRRLR